MENYLYGLTYEELDELRFEVINADPASPFINDISAAINRLQFPVQTFEGVVVEDDPVFVLQLAEAAG